ncbi:NUDIX hydrolase, partial [Leucobacter sp. M11]|uniref:NUDIX hydrolase n=1 Tax=Leucobacter sp. M11 TaxID=2993565 RepID=UPI002D7FAF0F
MSHRSDPTPQSPPQPGPPEPADDASAPLTPDERRAQEHRSRPVRDAGDAWVTAADGKRYWGTFGAAGLLAYDAARDAILLQHRVSWSDHGGTWGVPGGARLAGESAAHAAIRESGEEAGVPEDAVRHRFTHLLDRGGWTYATIVAEVTTPFEPEITDPESVALEWVPLAEVETHPLHPGFAAGWPSLRALLGGVPTVLVDAANVVGSVPNGWWRDRAGAAERLRNRLARLASTPVAARLLGFPEALPGITEASPEWVLVTEGRARGLAEAPGVREVAAPGPGDDAIVSEAAALVAGGSRVAVIT